MNEPHRLHTDLCVLDSNVDLLRRTKMQETNERLKRLGMRELKPLSLPVREVVHPGEVFYGNGQPVRRYFTPPKITIR